MIMQQWTEDRERNEDKRVERAKEVQKILDNTDTKTEPRLRTRVQDKHESEGQN